MTILFAVAMVTMATAILLRVWPTISAGTHLASPCGCQTVLAPITPSQRWLAWSGTVVAMAILAPLLVNLVKSFWQQWRLQRRTEANRTENVRHRLGIEFRLLASPRAQAFTLGFWRPRIYVTSGLLRTLSKSEVAAVLVHEQAHQRAKDPLVATIFEGIGQAWRWMPWVRSWVTAAVSLRELTADAAATRNYHSPEALAGAMMKLLETTPVALASFSPNASRVEKLLDHGWRPSWGLWRWQYLAGAVGVMLSLFLIARAQKVEAQVPPPTAHQCHEIQTMCRQLEAAQAELQACSILGSGRCFRIDSGPMTTQLIDAPATLIHS